ncbi:MAG: FAD-binding oxidoreductase, partial [Actinomycetota bacterium]|nr:FAD-binding oxidoreductase [Actinomycetota bacterium]
MSGTSELVAALHRHGVTEVDDSTLARAMYSSDASLYRVRPQVVVRPRSTEELLATLAVARESATPLTMRGAGTSIAGNALGRGIVVDTSRHLNRIVDIDPPARTATVQPGVVHASLQRQALTQGLRFGPDPSTHTRCTIGGMVGNNACGSRSLGYGRTVDNLEALTVALADGRVVSTGPDRASGVEIELKELADAHLATIRTEFGRFPRQVSGYSFEHLLPERGRRFDRFLVGTEGTLAVVLEAKMRLVVDPPVRAM